MPKTKRNHRGTEQTPKTDAFYELSDWMGLTPAGLVLKCGEHKLISKGRKEVLAKRLWESFNPQVNVGDNNNNSDATITAKENIKPNNDNNSNNNNNNNSNNNPNNLETVDVSLFAEAIMQIQEQQKLQQTENKVIQESLKQILQGTSPNIASPVPMTTQTTPTPLVISQNDNQSDDPSNNLTPYAPTNKNIDKPIHFQVAAGAAIPGTVNTNLTAVPGFDSHQLLSASVQGNSPSPDITNNPYIPPPITAALTAKIKKQEYVDLGEILACILPNTANMGAYTGTGGDDGEDYCLSQTQTPGTPLTFKKRSTRSPITNLASWSVAWNTFYEATLHYFPSMHYQLFSYFKHIIQYATNHKFTYLMAYDQTARLQIAAQRHLLPALQSTSWAKHSTALYNTYLRDNMKPQCSKCSAHDHFSNRCPKQSSGVCVLPRSKQHLLFTVWTKKPINRTLIPPTPHVQEREGVGDILHSKAAENNHGRIPPTAT